MTSSYACLPAQIGLVHLRILMRRFSAVTKEQHGPARERHYKNRVLAALPKAEINRLEPHLSPAALHQKTTLFDGKVTYGYFLEQGIASVVVTLGAGDTVEVGVDRRRRDCRHSYFAWHRAVAWTHVHSGGGLRLPDQGGRPEKNLTVPENYGDTSSTTCRHFWCKPHKRPPATVCTGSRQRLARWLATCRDRMDSDRLVLTHEFLGQMLGAPRTTVTLAAGILQRAGLIDYRRGMRDGPEPVGARAHGL